MNNRRKYLKIKSILPKLALWLCPRGKTYPSVTAAEYIHRLGILRASACSINKLQSPDSPHDVKLSPGFHASTCARMEAYPSLPLATAAELFPDPGSGFIGSRVGSYFELKNMQEMDTKGPHLVANLLNLCKWFSQTCPLFEKIPPTVKTLTFYISYHKTVCDLFTLIRTSYRCQHRGVKGADLWMLARRSSISSHIVDTLGS